MKLPVEPQLHSFLVAATGAQISDFLQNTVLKGVCFISKVEPAFLNWSQMIQSCLST